MRRYTITVNDHTYDIDVEERNADTFRVVLEGRSIDVRVDDHQEMSQALITPGIEASRSIEGAPRLAGAHSEHGQGGAGSENAGSSARSETTRAESAGPRVRRTKTAGAINAPMPGVVLNVQVSAGQEVAKGDPLLVLEAMKMENVLRAPRDGKVAEVLVNAGDQVKHGDPLVKLGDA